MVIYETKWMRCWKDGVRVKLYFVPVKTKKGDEDIAWHPSVATDSDIAKFGARFMLKVLGIDSKKEVHRIVERSYRPVEKSPEEIKKIRKHIISQFYGIG